MAQHPKDPFRYTLRGVAFALVAVATLGLSACCAAKPAPQADPVVNVEAPPEEPTDESEGPFAEHGDLAVGAPCGPGLGICDADSVCRFPAEAVCGDGGVAGVCVARPTGCRRDCPRVCSCDGFQFCNVCVAESRGFSIRHKGGCKEMTDVIE